MTTPNTSFMGSGGRRSRRPHAVIGAAVVCALLTACGTTLHSGGPTAGASFGAGGSTGTASDAAGLTVPGAQAPGTGQGSDAQAGSASSRAGFGGASSSQAPAPGGANYGSAATAPRSVPRGTPFKIGVPYSSSDQAALTALGGKGDIGNLQDEAKAVIAWLNTHGGVGGRPITPVWVDENAAEKSDQIASDVCAAWTQDNHVDAALPGGPNVDMDAVRNCLRNASIPAVSFQWHVQSRQHDLETDPLWVEPLALSMESYAKTYADDLAAQGFFKGGKLGILYDDGPSWTDVEQHVLEPELRRLGVKIVARASYAIRTFSDIAPAEPQLRDYALQFKSEGVDRVISFEPWQGWGFFMIQAHNNDYHPKWGLSSQTDWSVSYATGLVPLDEMVNAYYVGWSPVMDLQDMWQESSGPRWARLRLCDSIYTSSGIKRDGPAAEVFALALCDGLLDVAALGANVHGNLNRATFAQAVDNVAWQSAFLPTMALSNARRYGVTAVRPARWDQTNDVFFYTGPARAAAA